MSKFDLLVLASACGCLFPSRHELTPREDGLGQTGIVPLTDTQPGRLRHVPGQPALALARFHRKWGNFRQFGPDAREMVFFAPQNRPRREKTVSLHEQTWQRMVCNSKTSVAPGEGF